MHDVRYDVPPTNGVWIQVSGDELELFKSPDVTRLSRRSRVLEIKYDDVLSTNGVGLLVFGNELAVAEFFNARVKLVSIKLSGDDVL